MKMKTTYFYLDAHTIKDGEEHYVVVKSTAKDICLASEKAKQWAEKLGLRLAGGYFAARCKPHDFDTNYTVRTLPKHFRAKVHKEDFIDRLIAFESGDMSGTRTRAFITECKTRGCLSAVSGAAAMEE